jgi:predicted regulator of Ras-like GTPase activity (Roadblock/LC7/MglB family)
MASLNEALREIQQTHGLELAAVASADGLVVDSAAVDEIDAESICSVAANGMLLMDALAQELGEEMPEITTLEYASHTVVMAPLDDDNLLVLLAGAGMNLGRLRLLVRRQVEFLSQALADA